MLKAAAWLRSWWACLRGHHDWSEWCTPFVHHYLINTRTGSRADCGVMVSSRLCLRPGCLATERKHAGGFSRCFEGFIWEETAE